MNRTIQNIFAMAIIGSMPLTLLAQIKVATSTKATKEVTTTGKRDNEQVSTAHLPSLSVKSQTSKILGGEVKVLEKLRNAYSYYTEGAPFTYEDGSKSYFRVQRGPTEETKGNLYMMTSSDGCKTWTAPSKYYDATQEGQARYPSVQIINKNKSATLSDLSYVFFASVLKPKGDPKATFDGAIIGFKSGNQTADFFAYPSPENDNPDKQKWANGTSWATNQSKSTSYMVQSLFRTSNFQLSGQYGFLALTTATSDILQSKLPAQWGLDKFRAGSTDGSYNSSPHIDVDEEGTLYTLINNIYVGNDNLRLPSISKSSDGGKTWSDLEKMPESILSEYLGANGGDATVTAYPGSIAYNNNGFVVYGKDKYSFVTQITIQDKATNPVHIVEFYHDNGAWGIRKVANLTGFVPSFIYESSVAGTDTAGASGMDNEIQYVRTADGNLLVKYLDFTKQIFAGDTIDASDVFYCYRPMTSNKWSTPGNITNDAFFDKLSWLPTTIPNLKDIPLIQLRTVSTKDPATKEYLQDQRRIADEQEIIQRLFTPAPVGVQEEEVNPAGLTLRNATPNPASNSVEIPFSVEQSIETRIDLYTILGEKVATIQNGMTAPGLHVVVLNTDKLLSGTYYYTMTAGNAKLTKMLSVIR